LFGKRPFPVRNPHAEAFGTATRLFLYGIRLAGAERYLIVKEIMWKFAVIACKEAAPKLRSGSYADGMAVLESWERLVKSTSSALSQNKRSICLSVGRRSINISLESAPIHTDQNPLQRYSFIPELQVLLFFSTDSVSGANPYGKPCLSRTKPALKAIRFGKQLFPVRNYGWVGAE